MPDISKADMNEMISLVYRRWSEEYDLLKKVKSEKPDRSKDWHLFHAERLKNHTEREAKWKALLDRVKPHASFE